MLRALLIAAFLIMVNMASSVAAAYAPVHLFSRSDCAGIDLSLSDRDWEWLREKRQIVLGVAQPDFPPYAMTSSGSRYEGVNADIACLVGQALHLEIAVKPYPDRRSALTGLESGQIDLLGSSNNFEKTDGSTLLSVPYLKTDPALFIRADDRRPLPQNMEGLRIAVADDYLPLSQLHKKYPAAEFIPYYSDEQALAALAFGKVDLYLGDTLSSSYLINLNYFNYVRLHSFVEIDTGGFSFAFRRNNEQLRRLVNSALSELVDTHNTEITKRWSGGGGALTSRKIDLSPEEERWLIQHPVTRFVVNDDQAPFAFFDIHGNFSGIAADLLEVIQRRTGLKIQVTRTDTFSGLSTDLLHNKADLSLLTPTIARESGMRFTHPFISSPLAIVTSYTSQPPASLQELRGKRVAVPVGSAEREILRNYPDIQIVDGRTVLEALAMVDDGKADAMITTLHSARYYIAHLYQERLQITNIVGSSKGFLSFATRRADTELISILNKALLSIPPDELGAVLNQWRPIAAFSGLTWRDYKSLIYQIGVAAFLIILCSLAWNIYIRRQIRERRNTERQLNDQLKFMGALINGTPHPIYVRDREGKLLTCNNNYLETFGLTTSDVVGKTVLESGKRNRQEALQFHEDYLCVIERGIPYAVDRTLHVGAKKLVIYHWIQPFHDSAGDIKGVICGWIDISERRELIEKLRAAKELADESSRAKTTFLATMSHEIRTPMSAVIGMLELTLKRAEQGHFDRPAIEVAYDSAKGLLELIGDILDVVRIESGHVSLSPKRANLRELVESVARVFDGLARQKGLSLRLDIDANVSCDVLVDPMRFQQVLSNLVGNAIKFTDTGEVRVSLRGLRLADERLQVDLKVEDTGIGISSVELRTLFQPFSQADHGPSSRGGTGLGLAISKSLCELMGGHLEISSVLGKGTTLDVSLFFNILMPVELKPVQTLVSQQQLNTALRVLVVDDQGANRLLLGQQLSFLGQLVREAPDGLVALDMWRSEPFDIVITDCNMPVMNGYELARAIREDESKSNREPCHILGFTANAQPEERDKCINAGMNDCLFKPISLGTLSSLLTDWRQTGEKQQILSDDLAEKDDSQSLLKRLQELTGDDPVILRELLQEALSSGEKDLLELQSIIPRGETVFLADIAHRIKGAARIVNDLNVIQACDDLEAACRAPIINLAEVGELADRLGEIQTVSINKLKNLVEP
ncbi:sensory box histidine kinase/response regulator RocS1 [Pseudomonas synxantha BG33R]|uniref:transporter substrate-binding domain-containing protein n=1 Tax=Pseudomonas synxantha TaxID=47883 RepID=UPI00025FFA49|nr:transporter substrate-binding domain-containing protein [Pseudomonas synxantha]EIK71404.1 sensory box histidine kinase/response regulator RocS1 [Pseudomonas synxantha BG33R]